MFKKQVVTSVVQTAQMRPLLRSATWHRNIMSEAPLRRVIDANKSKEIRITHHQKSEGDCLWKNTGKYQFVNMRTNDQLINDGQKKLSFLSPPITKKPDNRSGVNVRQSYVERKMGKITTPSVYYTNDWSGTETTYNYMNQKVTAETNKFNSRRDKVPFPPVYSTRTAKYGTKLSGTENQNKMNNTEKVSDGKAVKIMKATYNFAENRKKNDKMAKYNEAHGSTQSKGICPIYNDDDDEPTTTNQKQKKPATKSSWSPASSDEHYNWYKNYKEPKIELKYQPHYETQLRKTTMAAGQQKQKKDVTEKNNDIHGTKYQDHHETQLIKTTMAAGQQKQKRDVRQKHKDSQDKYNDTKYQDHYETQSKNHSSEKPKKETIARKYKDNKKQLDYEKMEGLTRRFKKGLTQAHREPIHETARTNMTDEDWECNELWFL